MKFLLILISFFTLTFHQPLFAENGNSKIESFNKSKKLLAKIHIENPLTFYCQCKYNNKKPDWESCGFVPRKDKKRASRIEWEHILPASHFGIKFDTWKNGHPNCKNKKGKSFKGRKCTEKIYAKYRLMQADLYNLQPAIGEVNGLRSNYQIDIIDGEIREFGKCDIEIKNKKIEPSKQIRGDIARTYLYMEQSYPNYIKFDNDLRNLIIKWDKDDPIDDWECKRAKKIQNVQGNINQILSTQCENPSKKNLKKSSSLSNDVNKETSTTIVIQKDKKNIERRNGKVENNVKSKIGAYKGAGTNHALK